MSVIRTMMWNSQDFHREDLILGKHSCPFSQFIISGQLVRLAIFVHLKGSRGPLH